MKRHLAPVALLLAAAGCSSASSTEGPTAAAGSGPAVITATDEFRFTPARVTVAHGDVSVRLVGTGSYPHNISVPALHLTSVTVGTAPGERRDTTLHLKGLRPGTYRFVCTFHSKAGMTGELVVT